MDTSGQRNRRGVFEDTLKEVLKNNIVFIAGLPKSGTTWFQNLLCEIPGYVMYTPLHVVNSGYTDFSLREDTFSQISIPNTVIKLHTRGTPENISILHRNKVKYCIMYRDMRDVALSWFFYVKNVNPGHSLHARLQSMEVDEGLLFFIENEDMEGDGVLPYFNWLNNWLKNRDPRESIVLTYEALRAKTKQELKRVTSFFDIVLSDAEIDGIVKAQDFKRLSGRNPGEGDDKNFVRKGIIGDWRNYFTDEHKKRFKARAGKFLIDLGYESDYDW